MQIQAAFESAARRLGGRSTVRALDDSEEDGEQYTEAPEPLGGSRTRRRAQKQHLRALLDWAGSAAWWSSSLQAHRSIGACPRGVFVLDFACNRMLWPAFVMHAVQMQYVAIGPPRLTVTATKNMQGRTSSGFANLARGRGRSCGQTRRTCLPITASAERQPV